MKGLIPLVLGIFGTFTFSWVGLTVIPNLQIGHLDPQMDEEGTDVYPAPKSGLVQRGRRVYAANGCIYCHSQQLRADYAAPDIERPRDPDPHPKWGERRSAPRDYIFDRPVLLGKMRMGPDLSNMGKAAPAEEENAPPAGASPAGAPSASPAGPPAGNANQTAPSAAAPSPAAKPAASLAPVGASPPPKAATAPVATPADKTKTDEYSAAWHHRHLYSPRSISIDSNMPAYRFLYEKRPIAGERSADALELTGSDAPPAGWEIVPSYDANCLVAYLMSLDQSHPLKEVKGAAPAAPSAPAAPGPPAAAAAPSPAASPAKGGQ